MPLFKKKTYQRIDRTSESWLTREFRQLTKAAQAYSNSNKNNKTKALDEILRKKARKLLRHHSNRINHYDGILVNFDYADGLITAYLVFQVANKLNEGRLNSGMDKEFSRIPGRTKQKLEETATEMVGILITDKVNNVEWPRSFVGKVMAGR